MKIECKIEMPENYIAERIDFPKHGELYLSTCGMDVYKCDRLEGIQIYKIIVKKIEPFKFPKCFPVGWWYCCDTTGDWIYESKPTWLRDDEMWFTAAGGYLIDFLNYRRPFSKGGPESIMRIEATE